MQPTVAGWMERKIRAHDRDDRPCVAGFRKTGQGVEGQWLLALNLSHGQKIGHFFLEHIRNWAVGDRGLAAC
jgi:hypothetical protein